ncbi:MAG: ATPase, T2SS/T4P/T4SS family, partial [Elusimicrobiota bacterium]|nr:ATPase, T2SS/T4P/T4SS family [Elusimicrobiota bacterium]
YAALIKLNTPERNIMTIEDPVEYQIERINQIQVNTRVGITFASGLRTFLRQDPNVILVGEIRDKETAEIAVQAALTGHLVLSTLHTNDVPGTITRLLDIGIEPYMISATLICVVSQRLVRVLCPYCKQKYKPSGNLLRQLGVENTGDIVFYSPGGCKKCLNTGYAGREAIYEIFTISQAAKVLISTRPSLEKLRETFVSGGMKTLFENGLEKLKNGVTSIEEIMRVARFGGDNGGL